MPSTICLGFFYAIPISREQCIAIYICSNIISNPYISLGFIFFATIKQLRNEQIQYSVDS